MNINEDNGTEHTIYALTSLFQGPTEQIASNSLCITEFLTAYLLQVEINHLPQ